VRGEQTIDVPIGNLDVRLGQQIGVVIQRGRQPMLGRLKAEVTGVDYDLDRPAIELSIRHTQELEAILITEDGMVMTTSVPEIIMVEN
jgi:hypothetical protein